MKGKLFKVVSIILILSFISFSLIGCYGSFQLTKRLYEWNGSLGDKWVNSAVTWILIIVPVYEFAGFVDFVFLNVIEFWTGSNPVTMAPGEEETQIVELNGRVYEITASQNRFDIVLINNDGIDKEVSLVYETESESWFVESEGAEQQMVAQFNPGDDNILSLFYPDGQITNVDMEKNEILD